MSAPPRQRPPTRWPLVVGLAGVAASLIVAIAGPVVLPGRTHEGYRNGTWERRDRSWIATRYSAALWNTPSIEEALARVRSADYPMDLQQAMAYDLAVDRMFGDHGTILETGFPFRSFEAWEVEYSWGWRLPLGEVPSPNPVRRGIVMLPPRWRPASDDLGWLATHPMWPGLIGNALAWGGAFALLGWMAVLARTRRRTRSGLCTVCAYDLRATPSGAPCPECGARSASATPAMDASTTNTSSVARPAR